MIRLSPEAEAQLDSLLLYYYRQTRPEAARNLIAALDRAADIITNYPERGLPAPRPYPALAARGLAWLKTGRYWIAYNRTPAILAIFHDTATIPRRL